MIGKTNKKNRETNRDYNLMQLVLLYGTEKIYFFFTVRVLKKLSLNHKL